MSDSDELFERLVGEALEAPFAGWDWSHLHGRLIQSELPWDYAATVGAMMRGVCSMLDMGTGGGEFLTTLAPFPEHTCATEGYAPNLPIARQRLEPLGIEVFDTVGDSKNRNLSFSDEEFELVANRHESFWASEVWRILTRGGSFVTQQVGGRNNIGLNEWLQGERAVKQLYPLDLDRAVQIFTETGFQIVDAQEVFPQTTFADIGAVVYYLRAIPWQVRDFTVASYRDRLLAMHDHIQRYGGLTVHGHRLYLHATKPA
jgi:hypothetical protein